MSLQGGDRFDTTAYAESLDGLFFVYGLYSQRNLSSKTVPTVEEEEEEEVQAGGTKYSPGLYLIFA